MPISNVLSLRQIAEVWAVERRGTPEEKNAADILTDLLEALGRGELVLVGGEKATERAQDELQILLWEWDKYTDSQKSLQSHFTIDSLRITRDEFVRWVNDKGDPPATFWENKVVAEVGPKPSLREAPESEIKAAIKYVYDEADSTRTKPPNINELPDPVLHRLASQGFTTSKLRIKKIGAAFQERRGDVGKRVT